jgi:hypothetical protein
MEMEITFPGGARVDASFWTFTVQTDQPPKAGGGGLSAHTLFPLPGLPRNLRGDLRS